ncbi:hypothetical protein ITJ38_15205 [Agreia pratensis]|uniref:hypothetical protein n=1 Tax=Agreia pratensis TaxID=150121 RepID=UPI00188D7413|nr:hypothetical protein [Agreia pratensis]MBF4635760.1 hypothetical protein [Agreia pratensis]
MTNSPVPPVAQPPQQPMPQVSLPRVATVFYGVSPFLLLIGGFFSQVNARYTFDWAIMMTMIGTIVFWLGAVAFIIAIILSGVRSIAQQQVNILLQHDLARAGQRGQ